MTTKSEETDLENRLAKLEERLAKVEKLATNNLEMVELLKEFVDRLAKSIGGRLSGLN